AGSRGISLFIVPKYLVKELRLKLGIEPNEYKRMGQFKEKVLHLDIDQINKYTHIKAEYEQHKRGR
ncbi:RepB family plasmid replication initiator protein, partial [Acinetobacter baumannii]|nr:RepB family plasmid replication initiator protein [Acinetobacter baumannii]